jgi:hypothetical protein
MPEGWRVHLFCSNCGWKVTKAPGQPEIDAFEDVLEEGANALRDGLEPFVDDLKSGLITPDDFAN